jgi:hypothetical protein
MAEIPSYDQWMKDTSAFGRSRSDWLKKVDEALQLYTRSPSDSNRAALKKALDRWRFDQSSQGKDWKSSVRNQKGLVTQLHRALNDLDRRKLSKEEIEAMDYIARAQAMALQKQFSGSKLKFKANTVVGFANGVGSKWERFKAGASGLKSGASTVNSVRKGVGNIQQGVQVLQTGGKAAALATSQGAMSDKFAAIRGQVIQFCRELCPGLDPNKVFAALNLGSVETFATELAPFVGAISSGGKAIAGWAGVIKREYESYKLQKARHAIAAGDPEAAFDAVLTLLDREIKSAAIKAGTHSAAFTGKTLGVFADGGAVTGPVIGLLETLAGIFQTIVEYVRDYKECKYGNHLLKIGYLNLDLFSQCPILGCYFLVVQDHSTIINFAVGDYGTENWMFDVERLMKKIDSVLAKARALINASRFEIPGMAHAKGFAEKKGITDKILARLDGWLEKPDRMPKVDKSRIIGFGPGTAQIGAVA